MPGRKDILSFEESTRFIEALQGIQKRVQWKPGKGMAHLNKRRAMGHLAQAASMTDYEEIIHNIVGNAGNLVYIYEFPRHQYYGIRGIINQVEWLVIFGEGGGMETAFPPDDMDEYLERRGFVFIGRIEEVLKWTTKRES